MLAHTILWYSEGLTFLHDHANFSCGVANTTVLERTMPVVITVGEAHELFGTRLPLEEAELVARVVSCEIQPYQGTSSKYPLPI